MKLCAESLCSNMVYPRKTLVTNIKINYNKLLIVTKIKEGVWQ